MNELEKSAVGGIGTRWKQIALLWAVLFAEVLTYPFLAKWAYHLTGGQGGIGDEMLAYWLLYVVPGALIFGVVATLFYSAAARRGPRHAFRTRVGIWLSNVVLLGTSIAWYFHLVRRFFY